MKERYTNLDEYIEDLQEEIKKNENCANHYYNLGLAMLSKGDFLEAEKCFLSCLEKSPRSEEHTTELQSHSENSYAVFCL